ncbi:MAG: hypothetical protein Q4E13_12110 [Clostridia bacterium]|nr:hypothetical protein [Clostridia bacterium]
MNTALAAEILREELAVLGACAVLTALLFGVGKLWHRARVERSPAGLIAALLLAAMAVAAALYLCGRG